MNNVNLEILEAYSNMKLKIHKQERYIAELKANLEAVIEDSISKDDIRDNLTVIGEYVSMNNNEWWIEQLNIGDK